MSTGLLADPSIEGMIPQGLPILEPSVAVPAPRVNLLPVEIIEQRAVRRLAIGLAGAVAACAVLVGGGFVYAGAGEGKAQSDLSAAQSTQTRLQAQLRVLAPAKQAQAEIQAAQKSLAAAMGNEVLWSRYLDELRVKRPEGVRFTSVSLTPSGSAAASAGTTSGTTTAPTTSTTDGGIASLTLSGKARSQPDVAALLDQLAGIKGFTIVYLTSTSADGQTGLVTYSVSANVTAEALSHRYTGDGS